MQIATHTYRKITFIALVALIAIIVTGGAVRLTGSGLGCPDWPTCDEGSLVPDSDYHAWVEFVNRVITGAVAIAVILAVLGALYLRPKKPNLIWWAGGLVAGVLAQAILGGLVVIYHLTPSLVMAHFLLSMVLIYNAVVLNFRAGAQHQQHQQQHQQPISTAPHKSIIRLTRLASVLCAAIVYTGTILTGAGPHGGDEDVQRYDLDIPNLARIHSGLVISFFAVMALGWLGLQYYHKNSRQRIWRRGRQLLIVAASQAFIGYVQYFSDVPEILVGAHIAGAALLWTSMVYFHLEVCPPYAPEANRVMADKTAAKKSAKVSGL